MALTQEDLQAIAQVVKAETDPINKRLYAVQQDIAELKEETSITRHSVNLLLKWAEKADRTVVNAGLYDDK